MHDFVMEEKVRDVYFETRCHASRPYSSNYPPQQQVLKGGIGGRLLPYLSSFQGITQLKVKWRQRRRLGRMISLFVSAQGDYVAVASSNQITILQKVNNYQEPVGTFTCGSVGTFTCGTWSESHALLCVADDTYTIYVVKPNGEEITRITKKHLNVSSPIVGLIVKDDTSEKKSYLCTFTVVVSDGSFHDIEISKDPSACIFSRKALCNVSMLKEFPLKILCWDYHPSLSLLVVVSTAGDNQSASSGRAGSSIISVWRRKENFELESVSFTKSDGSYSLERGHHQLTSAKVLFSPNGKFVASLDVEGCLLNFQLDEEKCSLLKTFGNDSNSKEAVDALKGGTEGLREIVDFTWWSDDVLVLAKRNGTITMVEICSYASVSKSDFTCSMPLIERAKQSPGLIFLLESTLQASYRSTQNAGFIYLNPMESSNEIDFSKLEWSLLSFVKKSAVEIYGNLIASHRYEAALEFAERHGFDKDEVLKSQWLSSDRGMHPIINILPSIKDMDFVLSECVITVGPTEEAVRLLLSFGLQLTDSYKFYDLENDEKEQFQNFRLARLKLLLFRDKLETFLGINMGRFSAEEYSRFRDLPIGHAALTLAGSGKIGALNLLFKRHPYSLIPSMLQVLAAIPETIAVQSYGQLLPAISVYSIVLFRDQDWVECEKMAMLLRKLYVKDESIAQFMTEHMIMKHMKFQWPSISELSSWYKKRARDIDSLSGQLDNCMSLVDMAIQKGISELQQYLEDIFFLHQLIYSGDNEDVVNFSMSLVTWEQLADYEKFKLIMMGVKEDDVIAQLHKMAIPFMQKKLRVLRGATDDDDHLPGDKATESFLVRWLKESAAQNKLEMCLVVIEEGCRDMGNHIFFKDAFEMFDCALECIYLCTDIDRWSTMATLLSKLSEMQYIDAVDIKERFVTTDGHIEAGRLLAFYQVPKPIHFFLGAHSEEKGVKQTLRLLISKFIRWQPCRTDHDWANMWRDLQSLREKAFPFLDLEYMLIEFCRGLLKAGKFHLARNYLKGTSSVTLATDKADNLVIQAAREYFYSAPTLTSPEIWKAKECLNIFPSNRNIRVEADIVDALTVRLPNLGVNLLPVAFRQIKDPMEIMKLAITSQTGAYLNVDELIEIAKLLGLNSQEQISTVQEAIAREAAFAGDVQLAFDLCLVLSKKGHGSAWDLCAALARSQALESMDSKSQKFLLGFALSHCHEESICELLLEWKDLDMQDSCATLASLSGGEPFQFSEQGSSNPEDCSGGGDLSLEDQEPQIKKARYLLSLVARDLSSEAELDCVSLLKENRKVISFAASQLPWLLKLSEGTEYGKRLTSSSVSITQAFSTRTRALMTILSWLTMNSFTPRDDLIASLTKSIMESPVCDGDDISGCSVLLNLADAFHGAEIIEEQLKIAENYHEFSFLVNVGMIYSWLHSYSFECKSPAQRRDLLLNVFQEKQTTLSSEECTKAHEAQSSFWNEWKIKLERQGIEANKSRALVKLIPGVDTSRFLVEDTDYIQSVIFSFIESVKVEHKKILNDALILAQTYGLDRSKVLLHYLSTILLSEWSVDSIIDEVSKFKKEMLAYSGEVIESLYSVYSGIGGHDKQRLAFIYYLLSECYSHLEELRGQLPAAGQHLVQSSTIGLSQFYKIVGDECSKVSLIKDLNFKNIASLHGLNSTCFKKEVYDRIDEDNVEALAKMVQNLACIYGDAVPEGLLSWKDVYLHYVLSSLVALEGKADRDEHFHSNADIESFIYEIELVCGVCEKHMAVIRYPDFLDIGRRFFNIILLINKSVRNIAFDSIGKDCLIKLISCWLRMMIGMEELISPQTSIERFYSECSVTCLKIFLNLLVKDIVSPGQGWRTLVNYVAYGLRCDIAVETYNFCRAMIVSGCEFQTIVHTFSTLVAQLPPGSLLSMSTMKSSIDIQDLPDVYMSVIETVLEEIAGGFHGDKNMLFLLSSLSKLEGDLEDLKKVRVAVWSRLSSFSDDLQLPSNLRVYALELMQFISGRKRNLEIFPLEGQEYNLPWEGWDDFQNRTSNHENSSDDPSSKDVSCRFVALKSSQLVSSIFHGLEITPDDLLSVDSAVSCFLKLAELATSASHVDALLDLLAEWEGLFVTGKDDGDSTEVSDALNNWSTDDWDEGWESFQEEPVVKKTSGSRALSVHPLHICWVMILKKLLTLSNNGRILKLLDWNSGKNYEIILDGDDTRSLVQAAIEIDCFLALKMALLLPYETWQLHCLDVVEKKLNECGISESIAQDHFFLLLVLSSGILSRIIAEASYGSTFSYLSFMVGNFSRRFQEKLATTPVRLEVEKGHENLDYLFAKLLFPCFVAELVKADQHILAGFLVTRSVHTNPSLSLMSTGDASLRKYLVTQSQELKSYEVQENVKFCEPLPITVARLMGKLGNLIHSAISLLPTDFR